MLDSAQDTVYVEEFYIYKHWGDKATGTVEDQPNIYLEAVIDAARRGCQVKILMDGSYYNCEPDDPIDNDDTAMYVNEIAQAEGLDMEAKLVNLSQHDFGKIHNKGLISDDRVLISSINWNRNSVTENRETGLIIQNQKAAQYFTGIFNYDWKDDTEPPTARFSIDSEYQLNTTVNLSAFNSHDNVGIVNYTWELDGQPFAWAMNTTYNFTAAGSHLINLTVRDAWGNSDYSTETVNITVPELPTDGPDTTDEEPPEDDAAETAADEFAQTLAIMLLVPLFVFIAVIFTLYWRNR